MTVPTVFAGQVKHTRTTVEQPAYGAYNTTNIKQPCFVGGFFFDEIHYVNV